MRPGGRILGLAAAWVLAGSGCEYWENLTVPKNTDKVDLVLSLKDAWTGETLPSAWCSVDGAAVQLADYEGRITLPASPTGRKSVACSCAAFHARDLTLDARLGQGRFDIPMARKGGADWYSEEERRVRMSFTGGNFRFPGRLVVQGFPADSAATPVFQYTWTSTRHGGLKPLRIVPVETEALAEDNLEFTLKLTVTATLAGRTYEVGTDSQVVYLEKNQLPALEVIGFQPKDPVRVGTGCTPAAFALVHVKSWDPDGSAGCRVRLASTEASSPLGIIDTAADCSLAQRFDFPLISHDGAPDQSITKSGILLVTVTDANGGKHDTSLKVETYSNMHPEITLEQVGARQKNLTNQRLGFRIVARDRDTRNMQIVAWNWKDGDSDRVTSGFLRGKDSLDDTLFHSFTQAGTYDVEARVKDACGVEDTAVLSIEVEKNRAPTVSVQGIGLDRTTGEYEIRVEAGDQDADAGMDSLFLVVEWGDIGTNHLRGRSVATNLRHAYKPEPTDSLFEIRVKVNDLFNGNASDTLILKRSDVVGEP